MTEAGPARALEHLTRTGIAHEIVRYGGVDSAAEAAVARGIELSQLIKTLVVRRGDDDYILVLVPGDRSLDWLKLRRHLAVSRLSLARSEEAVEATGYVPGTITPFGALRAWPVILDRALLSEEAVSIGGGEHGVAFNVAPGDLVSHLSAEPVDVTR